MAERPSCVGERRTLRRRGGPCCQSIGSTSTQISDLPLCRPANGATNSAACLADAQPETRRRRCRRASSLLRRRRLLLLAVGRRTPCLVSAGCAGIYPAPRIYGSSWWACCLLSLFHALLGLGWLVITVVVVLPPPPSPGRPSSCLLLSCGRAPAAGVPPVRVLVCCQQLSGRQQRSIDSSPADDDDDDDDKKKLPTIGCSLSATTV